MQANTRPVRVALLGCGKRKQPEGRHTLRELYTGSLFRAALADADRRDVPVFVASALHGCRRDTYQAAPYDLTIRHPNWDNSTRRDWGRRVALSLQHMCGSLDGVVVELHMGKDYAGWIWLELRRLGATIETPVRGTLGARLAQYKQRREDDSPQLSLWLDLSKLQRIDDELRRIRGGRNAA